ncbi:MAG TPA: YihY/virulence factor BrkB family protein [Steroidobacteraceae bacterium]|jgi:membrane protein|nr:YihY/virulence factor BrkB family protein [Steroidobacteraceae bacterium]
MSASGRVRRATRRVWSTLRQAALQWNRHDAMRLSAALAFYSLLSLAPLILLTVALTGLIVGATSAQQQVLLQFRAMLGSPGEAAVRTMLAHARNLHAGSLASIVGMVTLLFSASQVFAELQAALNRIWEADPRRSSGLMALIRERFFSFGLVLSIGLLLLVSLLFSAALAALGHWAAGWLPLPEWMLQSLSFLISLVTISALFALIFKFVPEAPSSWRAVWIGAVATACLFDIGKTLIGIYLGKAGIGSTYGAAGSLVAVVIWVYYSSLIFFYGAEFTCSLMRSRSRVAHAASALAEAADMQAAGRPAASPRDDSTVMHPSS